MYRYVIYKLHIWASGRSSTPVANVILTLAFLHLIQLLIIYVIAIKLNPELKLPKNVPSGYKYIFLFAFLALNYFVLYNERRWKAYEREFSKESKEKGRQGSIYVLTYLIGSIVLMFLALTVLFY